MLELTIAARLVLVVVFAVAFVAKLRDPDALTDALASLGATARIARATADVVVGLEAAAVFALAWDFKLAAVIIVATLLAGFVSTGLVALAHGRRVHCGCFGGGEDFLGIATVVRAALLASALLLYASAPRADVPLSAAVIITTIAVTAGLLLLGRWILSIGLVLTLVRARRVDPLPMRPQIVDVLIHETSGGNHA